MLRLQIFAGHVANIMTHQAPAQFVLHPCEGVRVEVKIELSVDVNPIWDTVYINGNCAGNRFGGVKEFTALVNAAMPNIQFDELEHLESPLPKK